MMQQQLPLLPILGYNKRISIEKSKVVLCEGLEETLFFPRMFAAVNRLDLVNNIQLLTYDGKTKLSSFITNGLIKMPGYDLITSLGIMMDADGEPEGVQPSFESIKNSMGLLPFPIPNNPGEVALNNNLKSTIWILPDNRSRGEFEDVCINALTNHPMFQCLEPLKQCIQTKGCAIPRSAKAPLYTILAWKEPCGRRLGEIGNDFIRSWDLSAFNDLIDNFFGRL
jgi:hypothetical protein